MGTSAQNQLGHSTAAKHLERESKSKFTLGPINMHRHINKVFCQSCSKMGFKMSQDKLFPTLFAICVV